MLTLLLAAGLMGPPAPQRVATEAQVEEARGAWKWYAAAWVVDAGTTALALQRPGVQEVNPVFGDRPGLVLGVKAGLAVGAWRLGIHWTERGHPARAKVLRWVFVALSGFAGAWNVSVAW